MAVPDLAVIALCLVTLALLSVTLGFAKAVTGAFDIHIPGIGHPFAGIASALNNTLVSWLETALHGVEKVTAQFWNDLLGSLALLAALTILLGEGVKVALEYLWNHSLPAYVLHEIEQAIHKLPTVVRDAEGITAKVEKAVISQFRTEVAALRADAHEALTAARAAEAAAAHAVDKAAHAVTTEITNVVHDPATYVTNTVTEVVPGLADALTHAAGEVAELPGLAIPDLRGMLDDLDLGTLAGLMAAIPIIRAITSTLAVESGLENAECRGKIKQVCGTNPSAWASLIGGLAAVGVAFNLRGLVQAAEPIIADLAPVIRKVAE